MVCVPAPRRRDLERWPYRKLDVTFYKNGSVWFGPYGPYTPTCYGNKFLVVNSGDSFETFTFTKGYYEPNVNRGGTKR
jgi:hypothetical protein